MCHLLCCEGAPLLLGDGPALKPGQEARGGVLLLTLKVAPGTQSGLLAQVRFLRLPSGHSGPVLTLSNAARASLPSPRLLVADAVSVLLLCCGSYCWARNL